MNIAIIGSGIAGLVAAHRLSLDDRFQVSLFERNHRIGLESQCVSIPNLASDQVVMDIVADVPSRMFNHEMWPTFMRLLNEFGIQPDSVDPSQSFSWFTGKRHRTFLSLRDCCRPKLGMRDYFDKTARGIAREAARLKKRGTKHLNLGNLNGQPLTQTSFHEYLKLEGYGDDFCQRFLLPTLSSTVCTCSYRALAEYPADVVLRALDDLTRGQFLSRVPGGIHTLVDHLLRPIDDIRLDCKVAALRESQNGVAIDIQDCETEHFDHVIIATQANTAAALLPHASPQERDLLESIRYETIPVVVHGDERWMPTKRSHWSTFNMFSGNDFDSGICTVWMNRFHTQWDQSIHNVFQTIGPAKDIEENKTIAAIKLQRPTVSTHSRRSIDEFLRLQDRDGRRISYVGSWISDGIPLLESGVSSALACVDRLTSKALPRTVVTKS